MQSFAIELLPRRDPTTARAQLEAARIRVQQAGAAIDRVLADTARRNPNGRAVRRGGPVSTAQEYASAHWDITTLWYEPSHHIKRYLRGTDEPLNLEVPRDASNAWFKAIELFSLVTHPVHTMFDNASLPGDFIRAAVERYGLDLDWRANSLVGGGALEDRYHLVRDNPERWAMQSLEHSGDVTDPNFLPRVVEWLGDWHADLYTSDLGFGVDDYGEQERAHQDAHEAQVRWGLAVLRTGGTMIVKTFTMFEERQHRLLTWLRPRFRYLHVVKPLMSKADNAECYWVGRGYLGTVMWAEPENPYTCAAVGIAEGMAAAQAQKITSNVQRYRAARSSPSDEYAREREAWITRYRVVPSLPFGGNLHGDLRTSLADVRRQIQQQETPAQLPR